MKKVHFIAIGGAAMHNLALALNEKENYQITGSDDEIFEETVYDYNILLKRLREQAFLNGGIKIVFTDKRGEGKETY